MGLRFRLLNIVFHDLVHGFVGVVQVSPVEFVRSLRKCRTVVQRSLNAAVVLGEIVVGFTHLSFNVVEEGVLILGEELFGHNNLKSLIVRMCIGDPSYSGIALFFIL